MNDYKIQVYLDDGRIFEYYVKNESKAREHIYQIATEGYRHNNGEVLEYYPVHRIKKVKCPEIVNTNYIDHQIGT